YIAIYVMMCCFFFFFSSRRRHTRFSRDWSSDVCSSDLLKLIRDLTPYLRRHVWALAVAFVLILVNAYVSTLAPIIPGRAIDGFRSEERRVGKECRTRWFRYGDKRCMRESGKRMQ